MRCLEIVNISYDLYENIVRIKIIMKMSQNHNLKLEEKVIISI